VRKISSSSLLALGSLVLAVVLYGCGSTDAGGGFGNATGNDASVVTGPDGSPPVDDSGTIVGVFAGDGATSVPPPPCTGGGLTCYVPKCDGGAPTTLSGTVYDPAGKNPLYDVVVFVPNDPLGALPKIATGTHSCNTCDVSIGDYVAATTTDYKGHFTLTGVPATTHVPLVVQIGKWRREVFLPSVKGCTNNAVPATASRLPRSKSEGDMPQMALLTGGADQLGCFFVQMGIDPKEFSAPRGGGRLDIYQGIGGAPLTGGTAGGCTGTGCPLWSTKAQLEYYDIVILACEGGENNQTKAAPAMQNLHDWLGEGGKAFATHFHYTWFMNGPPDFQAAATWLGTSSGSGFGNFPIDTSFPKGKTFHDWLGNIGQLTNNTIALNGVATSVSTVNKAAQRWIYDGNNNDTKYLSILTPIGGIPSAPAADAGTDAGAEMQGPKYCGKAVFSDLHAGGFALPFGNDVPGSCTAAALTPQLAALEFLFFDLSACVAPENVAPPPPPPPMMTVQ
jgi:hypothetical protein